MKSPAVILSASALIMVGYAIKDKFPGTCAQLPIVMADEKISPIFIFALTYLTFERAISMLMDTRIRLVNRSPPKETIWCPRNIEDIAPFKILGFLLNINYLYSLLNEVQSLRFVVALSRIGSRLTGFVFSCYVPYMVRPLMFGAYSMLYGVRMDEAESPYYTHYRTMTAFFTRKLKAGVRRIHRQ